MSAAPFSVLIPARMASSRLPDKPLADIGGLPMVVRVAKQAMRSRASTVTIATDDARIAEACTRHQIPYVMTRADHASGSDRLAEAVQLLNLSDAHIVVNVQGDEPFVPAELINRTAALLQDTEAPMGTAAHAIDDLADYRNPHVVKVVLNGQAQAQYFSRAPIPWSRAHGADALAWWASACTPQTTAQPLRHIGIYSYRVGFLKRFPHLTPAPTETVEALEQLRVLWHGQAIAVHIADQAPPPGVDTPQDLEAARLHASAQAQN